MNNMEQIWKIRDARGLDAHEKSFLYTIASRGEAGMFCEWKRNTEDMGMKKDAYYARRNSLTDKGLITAEEQPYGPTIYKINDAGLTEWCATHSVSQNDDSVRQNEHSATQNGHSVRPERKRNIKINKKKNTKKNTSAPAGADTLALSPIDKDKDDEVRVPPAAAADSSLIELDVLEDSLIVEEAPASPIVEGENLGHSVRQNEDDYYEWNGMKVLRAGAKGNTKIDTAPVEPVVLNPCPHCSKLMDKSDLCWNFDCVS